MRQFNFTTNIEKRMPQTDNVYMVDRMTSDYAERFPLDVNGFIASVVQEFQGTEFAESYNTLLTLWNAVLGNRNECGDASLYPNRGGAHRPAAMKIWHMAGDYWRRGLRLNDTLPIIPPSCNITRLPDGGWIALFPKDKGLLNSEVASPQPSPVREGEILPDAVELMEEEVVVPPVIEAPIIQSAPVAAEPTKTKTEPVAESQPSDISHYTLAISPQTSSIMKAAGMAVAMSVALLIIWETGLLIPLGLIGLATGGILK